MRARFLRRGKMLWRESGGDGMEHAKAYLMETSAFREVIDSQMAGPSVGGPMQEARWTVANLVLSGCLDVDEEKAREQRKAVEGGSGSGTGGTSGFLAKQEVRMMSKQRAWVAGASEIIISAVPSNIVTATGLGIGVTPPSSSSIGSGSSFSSLSAAAASASLATTPSASAPASSPSLPLNKSKLLPPTPTTPTTPSHRRHHSKSDPSYSPSSMETIRAPSSTLPSPVKEPLPPRRHSANAAAVAAATPPSPGQTSPTKVGFAGIGSGYGSSSSPYHPQPSRAVSVPVPAPAVRPSTHTRSHPRSASGSGSGSAVDPEVGQINSGVNSRGWPSSAPAHSSGMKHYMVAGHSGGSSGPSTVMPSVVPTPSTTTLVEVRSEAPVSSESSTGTGTGIGAKRSLRRVEGSRRIVAAPPTPPDSDESATVHVDRHLQEEEKASIRFEENVYRVPGAGSEEISSDGGKRRLLHKARVRGEGDVNEGVVGEKQVKRVSSGTSSRWKFWKSAAR